MPTENLAILEKEQKAIQPIQSPKDQAIANKIWINFDKWRSARNRTFSFFRERTIYEYINDCNARFNNYKEKPAWKEEWQSNTSDITIHSKLMAIVAGTVVSRMKANYEPRIARDLFSKIKAKILKSIYDYIDTCERNGDLDDLFMALRAARDGTVIGFEGYKKTKLYDGIDSQIIPLEDFYPSDLKKFEMKDQLKCCWRTVMNYDDFKEGYENWYQSDKVVPMYKIGNEERTLFNISVDIAENEVEIIRYFDKLNNEFYATANSILIINPDGKQNKLSNRRKDGELGFWKTVYEPFDDKFFYGRALVDVMKDNQDAIDLIFDAMFDKEILAVLRPILVGGINELADDYLYPGKVSVVSDVQQIKEAPISSPDLVAFRILQELQLRQNFVSVGSAQAGLATGRKTATEVERAEEASRKVLSLFNVLLADGIRQKAYLRAGTIIQFYLKKKELEPLILESQKLLSGKNGTRIIRVKNELTPSNQLGYSKELEKENALIPEESEIIEISPDFFNDFKYKVSITTPSTTEMSPALQKAYDREFASMALNMPDVFNRKAVAKRLAESMNQEWDEIKQEEGQQDGQDGQMPELNQGKEIEKMMGGTIPSLKSQLTNFVQ
jgi:hypothetical protein